MEKFKKVTHDLENKKVAPRPPVVVVMGHVDHGKTTLLDKIRQTHITLREVGGITQRVSASSVIHNSREITFIDTPGHEAFAKMRERGGKIADLALLIVSSVEGIKPQTLEALSHINSAGIPYMVVLTKIDLPEANPRKVKEALSHNDVLVEDYGGKIVCLEVSGITGLGIEALLEMIILQADLLELKNELNKDVSGVILEARLDPKKGSTVLVVIREGALNIGDSIHAGKVVCKVRNIYNLEGKPVQQLFPGQAGEILGFKGVPVAGEAVALGEVASISVGATSEVALTQSAAKSFNIILRADSQGTLEAVSRSLLDLQRPNLPVRFLSAQTGEVTASDILLAKSNNARIISFSVPVSDNVKNLARERSVEIQKYDIIYKLTEEVDKQLTDILEQENANAKGSAEILKIFSLPSGDKVAGCKILSGRFRVGQVVNVIRDKAVATKIKIKTIKIKDEKVSSISSGHECGFLFTEKHDLGPGDLLEEITE